MFVYIMLCKINFANMLDYLFLHSLVIVLNQGNN
jgi:hypothetical protein